MQMTQSMSDFTSLGQMNRIPLCKFHPHIFMGAGISIRVGEQRDIKYLCIILFRCFSSKKGPSTDIFYQKKHQIS